MNIQDLEAEERAKGIWQRGGQTINMEPGIKCSRYLMIDSLWHELISKPQWLLSYFSTRFPVRRKIASNRKWEEIV